MIETCLVCGEFGQEIDSSGLSSGRSISCKRCGDYILEYSVFNKLQTSEVKQKLAESKYIVANISGWIRENQNTKKSLPIINEDCFNRLLKLKPISVNEKAYKLLRWLNRKTEYYGQSVAITNSLDELIAACYAVNKVELDRILLYLTQVGFIEGAMNHKTLTVAGLSYVEEYSRNTESDIGFCAMWFDPSVNTLWEKSIEPAIRQAGYDAKRIDKGEHIEGIVDEILALIRRSKFIVADLTGHRNGVYFEAGFARGLGVKVIFTCRKDKIEEAHFDVKHLNILDWEEDKLDNFKNRLQNRIEVNLGRGKHIALGA
jgi:hypothetical protein